jgi:hypothetical protein
MYHALNNEVVIYQVPIWYDVFFLENVDRPVEDVEGQDRYIFRVC